MALPYGRSTSLASLSSFFPPFVVERLCLYTMIDNVENNNSNHIHNFGNLFELYLELVEDPGLKFLKLSSLL